MRETGGFWRVVSDLLSWQGDIHAGVAGWGLVRLKNFETGVFNITSIELMVSGYDRPVGFWTSGRGKILPKRVDTYFNLTVKPPQDSPVRRLKTVLRIKAVFKGDDGSTPFPTLLTLNLLPKMGDCQLKVIHALIHFSDTLGLYVGKHVLNCFILLFSLLNQDSIAFLLPNVSTLLLKPRTFIGHPYHGALSV
ncbi:MAG: hypothetical protein QXH32_10715 [Candidatus Caldarchaeum sp.]